MLEAAGYEPNERFNAMNGGRRLVVYDMRQRPPAGRLRRRVRDVPQDPDRRAAGARPRYAAAGRAAADQAAGRAHNRKDVLDICALLLDHEVGDADDDTVNAAYIASLLAGDWGLWRTSRGTIETTRTRAAGAGLEPSERAVIDGRLTALWERVEAQPKSLALAQPGEDRRSHAVVRGARGDRAPLAGRDHGVTRVLVTGAYAWPHSDLSTTVCHKRLWREPVMADRTVTAVVTGAAMGMGKAISRKLIADGVAVVGLDLNDAALEETRGGARRRRSSRWSATSATGSRTSARPTPPSAAASCVTG